jgi:hypothetical protein
MAVVRLKRRDKAAPLLDRYGAANEVLTMRYEGIESIFYEQLILANESSLARAILLGKHPTDGFEWGHSSDALRYTTISLAV